MLVMSEMAWNGRWGSESEAAHVGKADLVSMLIPRPQAHLPSLLLSTSTFPRSPLLRSMITTCAQILCSDCLYKEEVHRPLLETLQVTL